MLTVFGANGRAGRETARALIARGEQVRVALRRRDQAAFWQGLGAEIAIADLEDEDSTAAALQGARAAFILCPPPPAGDPFAAAARKGAVVAAAIRRSGLRRAVLLSSLGAQRAEGTGIIATLHRMEAALAESAPELAFLRPGYFAEGWGEVAPAVLAEHVLPSFLPPELKLPMVSTMDVGAAAARLLCEPWSGRRIVELAGPAEASAADVAAAFGTLLGVEVTVLPVPPDQRLAILTGEEADPEIAAALLGMYDGIAAGRVAGEPGAEQWRGTVPLRQAVGRILDRLRAAA